MEEIIQKYGRTNDWSKVYDHVKTFDDLKTAMVAFLEGKVNGQPWHPEPVMKETHSILGKLLNINKKGFLSVEGHPAVCKNAKSEHPKLYKYLEQKSYIIGLFPSEHTDSLHQFLEKNKDVYYAINGKDVYYSNFVFHSRDDEYVVGRFMMPWDELHITTSIDEAYLRSLWRHAVYCFNRNNVINSVVVVFLAARDYCNHFVEDTLVEYFSTQQGGKGSKTYQLHKGKKYLVRVGKKGGKFIEVQGNKIYI